MRSWSITILGMWLVLGVGLTQAAPVPTLTASQQEQIERLIASLRSNDKATRDQAVEGLVRIGRPALAAMVDLVESGSSETRGMIIYTCYAMVRSGPSQRYPEMVPLLTRGLLDQTPGIRKAAALAASEIVTILVDPASERTGVQPKDLPFLVGQRREEFIQALVSLLGDADDTVRISATTALTYLGREALPYIVPILEDNNQAKRLAAARVIADLGSDGRRYPQLLPDLLGRLEREKDQQVVAVLSRALGPLAEFLHEPPPKLLAYQQLPKLTAGQRQEVYQLMIAGLAINDSLTRRSLVDSLARLGPTVDEFLLQGLKSAQPRVRAGVLEVLIAQFARGKQPLRFVTPVLMQLELEKEAELRLLGVQTLARFAPALAPDAPANVRTQVAALVPEADQRKFREVLVQSLGTTDEVAKQAVMTGLANLHESVAEAVADVLEKGQPSARQQAALTLRAMKGYGQAAAAVRRAAQAVIAAGNDSQTVSLAQQIIARLDQMK